jgi:hypothetical protein
VVTDLQIIKSVLDALCLHYRTNARHYLGNKGASDH